jgi:hypothetical protein
VLYVDVELTLLVVQSEGGAMDTDDVTNTVDNWEVFKAVGINDNSCVVLVLGAIEAGVDNLEGADEAAFVDFVWEGGVNDHTIDVGIGLHVGESYLVELGIAVALTSCLFSCGFGGGFSGCHGFCYFRSFQK